MLFIDISVIPCVRWSGTIFAIILEGIMGKLFSEIILNLD